MHSKFVDTQIGLLMKKRRRNDIVIPFVSGVSEKMQEDLQPTQNPDVLQTQQHTWYSGTPQRLYVSHPEKQSGVCCGET